MLTTAAHAQRPATPAELEQQVKAVREQLRIMQDQQRALTQTLDRLQQQLALQPPQAAPPPAAPAAPAPQVAIAPAPAGKEPDASLTRKLVERYQDGIVVWRTD